jgi:hypothetical protein
MELIREVPDTSLASRFDGEPMVQSFVVVGRRGRVWITTAEALTVPAFGRPWVEARLAELRAEMGARAFERALRKGLRLHATPAALPLAA